MQSRFSARRLKMATLFAALLFGPAALISHADHASSAFSLISSVQAEVVSTPGGYEYSADVALQIQNEIVEALAKAGVATEENKKLLLEEGGALMKKTVDANPRLPAHDLASAFTVGVSTEYLVRTGNLATQDQEYAVYQGFNDSIGNSKYKLSALPDAEKQKLAEMIYWTSAMTKLFLAIGGDTYQKQAAGMAGQIKHIISVFDVMSERTTL
ncbi:Hypothetical protein HDN1F_19840 [gamma proteobacterium HdN1]|nr:Hypothetical protein HDN1F_19840 [gamma proteobacterium HdN1]